MHMQQTHLRHSGVAVTAEVKTLVQWAASEEQASLVNNQAQEGLFRMDENNQRSLRFVILMM